MTRLSEESSHALGAKIKEYNLIGKAIAGDILLTATPATVGTTATSAAISRTVTIHLKDALGNYHTWADTTRHRNLTNKISASQGTAGGSTSATASASPATLQLTNGKLSVTVSSTAGSHPANNTLTMTLAACSIAGVTFATVTSVQTFV